MQHNRDDHQLPLASIHKDLEQRASYRLSVRRKPELVDPQAASHANPGGLPIRKALAPRSTRDITKEDAVVKRASKHLPHASAQSANAMHILLVSILHKHESLAVPRGRRQKRHLPAHILG